MAAQFTEVTLDDMEKFLKRGFRALRPKQGVQYGEYYYDLGLSDYIKVRVWTSVRRGSGMGAGVGEDAIRVQLMSIQANRPLQSGKAPIVKRTQGWRNKLQDKIEAAIETSDEMASKGDDKQAPPPAAPTPPPAKIFDDNDGESYADDPPPPPPGDVVLKGTFVRDNRSGGWGAKIHGNGRPGARAILETKGNRKVPVTLVQRTWSGRDQYNGGVYAEIWTIEEKSRTAGETAGSYDYDFR